MAQPGSATAALAGILLEHPPVATKRKRVVPKSGMYKIRNQLRCRRGEDGQTTVEYALILAALAIAAIVAVVYMSGVLRGTFRGATPSADAQSTATQAFRPPVTCDANYSGACIPSPPPDVNCDDFAQLGVTGTVTVGDSDPQHLDADGDGIACN